MIFFSRLYDANLIQPSTLRKCVWSLIGNWEWSARLVACQSSYLDISWFSWAWQKCALKDRMIHCSRGWHSLIAFGGKKIIYKFWNWEKVSCEPDGSKIFDAQTWDEKLPCSIWPSRGERVVNSTWIEHATFWSGVRRVTIAPRISDIEDNVLILGNLVVLVHEFHIRWCILPDFDDDK